jgi:hypothetical protein
MRGSTSSFVLISLLGAAYACGERSPDASASRASAAAARADSLSGLSRRPGYVVDSILPVDEELRRFRAGLGAAPTALSGGARTRQALVDSFSVAVSHADSAALARLVLTRAEFAYLVYPGSAYTRPPYQQSPELVWMQLENAGAKGATRLIRRLGHRPLTLAGHRCTATPEASGATRLWRECVALVVQPDGSVRPERLFGVIVERDGRFKFASLANRM